MDRTELVEEIQNRGIGIEAARSALTLEKIKQRAVNIRKTSKYVIFDIKRHPWVGDGWDPSSADETVQTYRFPVEGGQLELCCEFHARSFIAQNEEGDPVCANCGTILDRFEEVFEFVWRCGECGAIGGKRREVLDPTIGEAVVNDTESWEKFEDKPVWVPKGDSDHG